MPSVTLIRRTRFSAGHHYHRPDWSEEENRERFGRSVHRHGHNYEVAVSVEGPVEQETGFVMDLGLLDDLLESVAAPLDQRDLTDTIPRFRPGGRIPSTENLALWFWEELRDRIPAPARLRRVRVWESGDLAAEVSDGGGAEVPRAGGPRP